MMNRQMNDEWIMTAWFETTTEFSAVYLDKKKWRNKILSSFLHRLSSVNVIEKNINVFEASVNIFQQMLFYQFSKNKSNTRFTWFMKQVDTSTSNDEFLMFLSCVMIIRLKCSENKNWNVIFKYNRDNVFFYA